MRTNSRDDTDTRREYGPEMHEHLEQVANLIYLAKHSGTPEAKRNQYLEIAENLLREIAGHR